MEKKNRERQKNIQKLPPLGNQARVKTCFSRVSIKEGGITITSVPGLTGPSNALLKRFGGDGIMTHATLEEERAFSGAPRLRSPAPRPGTDIVWNN